MLQCNWTNTTINAQGWIYYVSEMIMLPCYLIIASSCNIILLIAFYKQAKKEGTYNYQVLLTVSKTMEVVTLGTYLLGLHWFSEAGHEGADWFQRSYFLMFTTFKVLMVFSTHFILSSALLATAMAADRVFALALPLRYRNINHGRHQIVAGLVCFTLPAVASINLAWLCDIEKSGADTYVVKHNPAYISIIGRFCAVAGASLRITCTAALIPLNVLMVALFKKRTKNITKMTNQQEIIEAQKSADRTLLVLNVYQSILMCINQIPQVILHMLLFAGPRFLCACSILFPLSDATIFLTDSIDLAVVLCVNKKMRRMVGRVIGWKCCPVNSEATGDQNQNGRKVAWEK